MLVVNYTPGAGWSVPEIKPYGPLSIDPMSSCLQYCPNVFEGMKVCPSTLCGKRLSSIHSSTPIRRIWDRMERSDYSDRTKIWSVLLVLPLVLHYL